MVECRNYFIFLLLSFSSLIYSNSGYNFLENYAFYEGERIKCKILSELNESCIPTSSLVPIKDIQKLFVISKDSYNLHSKIFSHLKTESGQIVSKKLLINPISQKKDILSRQSVIKQLYKDVKTYNFINKILSDFHIHEDHLMQLWSNPISKFSEYKAILIKNSKNIKLENSPKIMALNYWKNRILYIGSPILAYLIPTSLGGIIDETKRTKDLSLTSIFNGIKGGIGAFFKEQYSNYSSFLNPFSWAKRYSESVKEAGNKYTGALLLAIRFYNCIALPKLMFQINSGLKRDNNYLVDFLMQEIRAIFKLIRRMKKLNQFCEDNPEFSSNLYGFKKLKEVLDKCDDFISNCISLSRNNLWTKYGKNAYLVAAYNNLEKIKPSLAYFFEIIGEIDTYFSLATLIKEKENNNFEPFNFAKIEEESKSPQIELINFYNPLIKNNRAISTLKMDGNGNHILLEGPHACGKSTLTRAIAYNFILMHCFGIVSGTEANFTIFDQFLSYSNVTENPELNLSGFDAQLHELVNLKETIANLTKNGKKIFCFLDEPLTGTMEEAGAQELKEFCNFIGKCQNNLCMLATHFNNVTSMDVFKPHYVICEESANVGEFIREYTIAQGKHPWWYNDTEKRKRYIDWMRKKARNDLGFI